MSKYQWISILGVWVMAFLFLGFPSAWDEGIAVATGLIIIAIAYRAGAQVRLSNIPPEPKATPAPTFTPASTPSAPVSPAEPLDK